MSKQLLQKFINDKTIINMMLENQINLNKNGK